MLKFLIKGLLRDRSRSLFPLIIIAAGVFITILFYSFIRGIMGDLVESNARFDTGHLKVMTRPYRDIADQMPNDFAITGAGALIKTLMAQQKDITWLPRIRFGGLLDIPNEKGETRVQGPVLGLAVDLFGKDSPELLILNLKKSLVRGVIPQKKNEILLSEQFASKLNVGIGDTATLIGSTMNGDMAVHNFKVAGLIRFGITALDRGTMIADISDARDALDMADAASEIVGFSKDNFYNDKEMVAVAKRFNSGIFTGKGDFSPVMLALRDQNDMGTLLDIVGMETVIIIGLFIFIMSIVLWNSGLMNGIRRYGEIGVRLALGEPKGALYRRMILEALALGFAGTALGGILGLSFAYYMQNVGITLSTKLQSSSVIMSDNYHAKVDIFCYCLGFIPGLFAPVLGTAFAGIGIYRRQTASLFKELEV